MYQFKSRVRYSEVNSENTMTLAALLDYLQDCCTFQSEELGVGVDYLKTHKKAWVLSSWQIRIRRYPSMGESITISTWAYDFKGFYGYRNFKIETQDNELLAYANSIWVYMDLVQKRPVRIDEQMVQAYMSTAEEAINEDWGERRISVPKDSVAQDVVSVHRFHIDTNHHVNNGKYVQIAEEYLPEGFLVNGLRVEYKKAAVLGDVFYPSVAAKEDTVTVTLADADGKPYAIVQFQGKGV